MACYYFISLWYKSLHINISWKWKWQVEKKRSLEIIWYQPIVYNTIVNKYHIFSEYRLQVNLCQKLLFLHQLTHNMMTICSLNYKFNAWKFQAQTWGEHVVYRNCFWHFKKVFVHNMFSPCIATRRASDTDLPATHKYLPPTYTFSLTYTIYWAT